MSLLGTLLLACEIAADVIRQTEAKSLLRAWALAYDTMQAGADERRVEKKSLAQRRDKGGILTDKERLDVCE